MENEGTGQPVRMLEMKIYIYLCSDNRLGTCTIYDYEILKRPE